MKPIDVTSDSYSEYNEDSNEKDPKFKVGDHVRIWRYKNIFPKGYSPNWSEENFVVSKVKYFLNHSKILEAILMLKSIVQITQANQISKTFYTLIL